MINKDTITINQTNEHEYTDILAMFDRLEETKKLKAQLDQQLLELENNIADYYNVKNVKTFNVVDKNVKITLTPSYTRNTEDYKATYEKFKDDPAYKDFQWTKLVEELDKEAIKTKFGGDVVVKTTTYKNSFKITPLKKEA